MKQLFLVAVATVLVFGVGFATGRWYELRRPLPPPPASFMGEFGGHRDGGPGHTPFPRVNRADFMAAVERLRPQIEAFRKSWDEIDDQFERGLDPLLTPEQRAQHAERLKRRAEFRTATGKGGALDDQHLMRLAQWPNWVLFRVVTLQVGLDDLNRELKLDDAQRDQVLGLLRTRRDRFLALIDRTPPPSLALLHLAPYVQHLGPPPPDAPAGAQSQP